MANPAWRVCACSETAHEMSAGVYGCTSCGAKFRAQANPVRDLLSQASRAARRQREREEREDAERQIVWPCSCGSRPTLEVCDGTGAKRVHCLGCMDAEYGPDGPRANHYVRAEGKTWRDAIDAWDGDRSEEAQ